MLQQPAHILIADDEEDWRERIASSLQRAGYYIDFATTHKEAIEKLNTQKFDVACMNILLRGEILPGWKLDWTLLMKTAKERQTSIIVITAMGLWASLPDIYDPAMEFGVKKVFFKEKIEINELLERVKMIVSERIIFPAPPKYDLSYADRKYICDELNKLPKWRDGGVDGKKAVFRSVGLEESWIAGITLTGTPAIDTPNVLVHLESFGYLPKRPTHTALGAVVEYLSKNTDVAGKEFLESLITKYHLINESE